MRGLRPLTGTDPRLTTILLRGEFAITGFRNRALRGLLFPHAQPRLEQRRASGQVTRLLGLFRAHGLIRKLPGAHSYQLTTEGSRSPPAFLAARNASIENLNAITA